MTVSPMNYSLKTDDVEVVKFTGDATALEEIRDWVSDQLEAMTAYNVQLDSLMYGTALSFSYQYAGGTRGYQLYQGEYIVKDSDGLLVRMNQDQLDMFYKPAV